VALEEGISKRTITQLSNMGHHTELITGHARATFGRGQIIIRDAENGVLCGGSDPRADGCAVAQT
jgi:gamma-glutamyltranspeptidase/glutathione hydrolase